LKKIDKILPKSIVGLLVKSTKVMDDVEGEGESEGDVDGVSRLSYGF
jgi:hypothetical protein